MHGGAIGFASNAGSGSTFSFYVKCRKSQSPLAGVRSDDATTQGLHAQTSFPTNPPSDEMVQSITVNSTRRPSVHNKVIGALHVLIVEDNLVNQRVLAKQLRNIGTEVAVANHGVEALDYLRKTKFCTADASGKDLSLILMDWEMPVMDGLTCVREIRQLQKDGIIRGHVPVIAVTANVRSEQVKAAVDAGMDDVVSKPFRVPELLESMRKQFNITHNYG